jgi:chromosome segregation ATPase
LLENYYRDWDAYLAKESEKRRADLQAETSALDELIRAKKEQIDALEISYSAEQKELAQNKERLPAIKGRLQSLVYEIRQYQLDHLAEEAETRSKLMSSLGHELIERENLRAIAYKSQH